MLALAAAAWGVVAVLLATGVLSGSKGSSASNRKAPPCLPGSLRHDASLPGTSVSVSPAPGTQTADPHTQISFLGAPEGEIHDVSATGSRSGDHSGRLAGYSQGDGASFLPSRPFAAGEQVSVHATIGEGNGAKPVTFSFHVDTPYSTAAVGEFPNPQASPAEYQSFRTLPGVQAPTLTVTTPDRDPGAGDILTTNGPGPGRYGPLIYSPTGRLLWFHQLSGGLTAENLSVQSYEGRRDLTYWQGKVLSLGFGQGEDLVLNSHYEVVSKVRGGNGLQADLHDFQIAPHGVAYTTAFDPIRCDLSSAEGGRDGAIIDTAVQEIDMKTGLVRWEWHSLDHVGVAESQNSPSGDSPWDWFHVNSIDAQGNGDVFISARNTWAGYQIQESTGDILWRLGGSKSSFQMGPGTKTAWQHDGRILPNGEVTFFDDGSNPPAHKQSRAVRIALNFKTRQARLTSQVTHAPPLLAASQGNVQTLPDEHLLIGWGGVPQISEHSQSGSLLFDAHLPPDNVFYRAFRFPWSGRPASPPAVLASLNNTEEETIVRMSWNGATEVSSWRVLAGPRPGALSPRATAPDSGFESSAILPSKYAYAEVQALGGSGEVLSSSPASRVIGYKASFTAGKGSG